MKKLIYIVTYMLLMFLLIFPVSGWAAPATLATCQGSNEICFCDYSDNSSCAEGEAYWNGYATFTALLAGEDALADDDIVDVGDGAVYREQWTLDGSGSSGHPITIRAKTGDSPIISGADIFTTWIDNTGSVANTWYASVTTEPSIVYFNDIRGTPVASVVACDADKKWYWEANKLYTYGTVDPNTTYPSQIEAAQRDYGIRSQEKSYISIEGITTKYPNLDGVQVSAWGGAVDTISLTGVESIGSYRYGISFEEGGTGNAITNITVTGCTTQDTGNDGLILATWGGGAITNVLITGHTSIADVWRTTVDKSGIKLFGSDLSGAIIENCVVYNTGITLSDYKTDGGTATANGIYIDTVGANVIARYNLVHDVHRVGMLIEYSDGVAVHNNVVHSNGDIGITLFRRVHDNLVYNNTLYGNDEGICVFAYGDVVEGGVTGNLIKNNISFNSNDAELIASQGGENDGTNGSGNVYLNNCFGPEAADFVTWGAATPDTYDVWETAYGGTTSSAEADPLFTNAAGGDFTLKPGSPARHGAVYIPGYTTKLRPEATWPSGVTTMEDILSIGAYGVYRGAAGM